MRRIRLIVSYDGTNYCGWQIQENAVTVEGTLTDALRKWLKEDIEIIGASRTDSGVHAYGNIAVFDTYSRIPAEKFAIGLNHYLPEDIRVQKSDEVESDYHPRYRNTEKTYEYTILNTKINLPIYSRYSYHVYHPLDFEAMKEAAALLVGEHDFSAFCSAGSQVKSKVRTIYEVSLDKQKAMGCNGGEVIRIRVRGNGFLYNMVRIIAGTLVEVGEAEAPPMVDPTGQGYYITRMDLNAYFGSVNVACYSSANGGFSAGADSRRNGKGSARNDLN